MNEPVSKIKLKCCPHCNYTEEKFNKNKVAFIDFDKIDTEPTWEDNKPFIVFAPMIGAWGSWVIRCPICGIMIVYSNDMDEGAIMTWNELKRESK